MHQDVLEIPHGISVHFQCLHDHPPNNEYVVLQLHRQAQGTSLLWCLIFPHLPDCVCRATHYLKLHVHRQSLRHAFALRWWWLSLSQSVLLFLLQAPDDQPEPAFLAELHWFHVVWYRLLFLIYLGLAFTLWIKDMFITRRPSVFDL